MEDLWVCVTWAQSYDILWFDLLSWNAWVPERGWGSGSRVKTIPLHHLLMSFPILIWIQTFLSIAANFSKMLVWRPVPCVHFAASSTLLALDLKDKQSISYRAAELQLMDTLCGVHCWERCDLFPHYIILWWTSKLQILYHAAANKPIGSYLKVVLQQNFSVTCHISVMRGGPSITSSHISSG